MPLYEYRCLDCGRDFELLVSSGDTPACPSCASSNLKKLLSTFAPSVASRSSFPSCDSCPAPHSHSSGCGCSSCCPHSH